MDYNSSETKALISDRRQIEWSCVNANYEVERVTIGLVVSGGTRRAGI